MYTCMVFLKINNIENLGFFLKTKKKMSVNLIYHLTVFGNVDRGYKFHCRKIVLIFTKYILNGIHIG